MRKARRRRCWRESEVIEFSLPLWEREMTPKRTGPEGLLTSGPSMVRRKGDEAADIARLVQAANSFGR